MTVMEASHDFTGLAGLSAQMDSLAVRLNATVEKLTGDQVDAEIIEVVRLAVEAFVEHHGRPREAAKQVAREMHAVGVHQAQTGRTSSDMRVVFDSIRVTVMAELQTLAGPAMAGQSMPELRARTARYLETLCLHSVNGVAYYERSVERERDRVRSYRDMNLARPGRSGERDVHAEDVAGLVRAVVAVNRELPDEVRHDPAVIGRDSRFEVLVPESVDLEQFATRLNGPVVYGPLTSWSEMPEAMTLVWRAAQQIRGQAHDRILIPCDELAGHLVLSDNPVLRRLLVRKHLPALAAVPAARRAALSESLLLWLERGCSLTKLAAEMNLPTQTLHTRVTVLREMFGDVLEDPIQRLELIVALQTVLPGWTAKAS